MKDTVGNEDTTLIEHQTNKGDNTVRTEDTSLTRTPEKIKDTVRSEDIPLT